MIYAVRVLAYGRGGRKEFLCLLQLPAQHKGPPNPTVQGYYIALPQAVNRKGRGADHLSPSHAELKNKGTCASIRAS